MAERRTDVDALRGAVMVLMALDHVRDFFSGAGIDPLDLEHTTAALFLTRWVTHFCAPVFVCLAGVSARLLRERGRSLPELSWFLASRGLWLVVVELTVVRVGWLFDLQYQLLIGQVIWAIGWSMVTLAALVWLPEAALLAVTALVIVGHNALDGVRFAPGSPAAVLWQVLHTGGPVPIGTRVFFPAYPLIPWPAVMALGYLVGGWIARGRHAAVQALGAGAIVLFIGLRAVGVYGDAHAWASWPDTLRTALAFLDTTKYPPSLLYVLMTLGPAFVLLPWLDRLPAAVRTPLVVFGRVPLFYYVAHLYLIHLLAIAAAASRGVPAAEWIAMTTPFGRPPGHGYGLPVVYAVWAVVVALLWAPCRWFAGVKARSTAAWLSYL